MGPLEKIGDINMGWGLSWGQCLTFIGIHVFGFMVIFICFMNMAMNGVTDTNKTCLNCTLLKRWRRKTWKNIKVITTGRCLTTIVINTGDHVTEKDICFFKKDGEIKLMSVYDGCFDEVFRKHIEGFIEDYKIKRERDINLKEGKKLLKEYTRAHGK